MLILRSILIIILAPIVGGLLTGIDRIVSARMQGRVGPPLLQPFYDVIKLIQKETIEVNKIHRFYVYISFAFMVLTAVMMLSGGDILLAIFAMTLGGIFFTLGGYASNSPYSIIGSERELLQMMAYEPMVLIVGAGLYYANGSFFIKDMIQTDMPAIVFLPGIFVGLVFIMLFKLRKAPFDLSMSHHAHQEIVQGIQTEYSGRDLAVIQLTHWYETIIVLAMVYLFFATEDPISIVFALIACSVVFFIETLIGNACARVKWQEALKTAWIISGILGVTNLIILSFFR